MFKKSILLAGIFATSAIPAFGTISLELVAEQLQDANGLPLSVGSVVALVASTSNATFDTVFEGQSNAVGSRLSATGDDYIVYRTTISVDEGGFAPGLLYRTLDQGGDGALDLSTIPGWNPGDPLALMWFPTLTGPPTLLASSTPFGRYSNSSAVDGSSQWLTPADGSSGTKLYFWTQAATSGLQPTTPSNPATAGRATQNVAPVPEPTSLGLLALGFAGLAARRRRK